MSQEPDEQRVEFSEEEQRQAHRWSGQCHEAEIDEITPAKLDLQIDIRARKKRQYR